MNILITGGAGFIGKHTAFAAVKAGHQVRVLDSVVPNERICGVEYVYGSVLKKDDCSMAISGIDQVIHLAAYSRSGPSIEMWPECLNTNINGTINILEASVNKRVSKFVYAGSSTFYGNQLGRQKVGDPGDFLNFYGLSKYVGEEITNQFSKHLGLNTTNLRYFNVYGNGQPTDGTYGLVMGIFLRASKDKLKVEIHGTGDQRRDFVHVEDVANANLAALSSSISGETYNIGSGQNVSINELAELFELESIHVSRRPGDAEITLADIDKTISELNWRPRISLNDGIRQLLASQEE